MNKEVITLCKLIFVNPATTTAGERSFSIARRLKRWLQERFSNLTVLNIRKERTAGFPPLTSQANFPTATQTESVILVLFKYMMYSNFNIIHLIIFSYLFVKFQTRGNILNE